MGSTTLTRADLNSDANQINYAINQELLQLNTLMLCKVIQYYPNTRTCDVTPIINSISGNGTPINPPTLFKCPISDVVGNGCGIEIAYSAGDIVYVGFCQRDISNIRDWWANGNTTINAPFNPQSYRICDIADGIILFRVSNQAPTIKIKITTDGIDIESVGKPVTINAQTINANITGNASITANEVDINSGNINLGSGGAGVLTGNTTFSVTVTGVQPGTGTATGTATPNNPSTTVKATL